MEKSLCDNFGRNLLTKRESWVIIINVDDTLNRIKVTNYKPVVAETGTEVSEDSFLLLPYYPNKHSPLPQQRCLYS